MNFVRKFQGSFQSSRYKWINQGSSYQLLDKENAHGSRRKDDKHKSEHYTADRYTKFDENQQATGKRKRTLEDFDNDFHSKKPRVLNVSYERSNSMKRSRSDDDEYDLRSEILAKKQRLSAPVIQYAIKRPNQNTNAMRKILEKLFEPEITADGWEKYNEGFQYHTKIRGQCFYQLGNTVDNAKELVAETALKELCNFKYESILWPDKLLPFRLNQDFADEIEKLVKYKFDKIMVNDCEFKGHKVRSGIVMTTNGDISNGKVVAIGTGTKCQNIIDDGDGFMTILHDMHAEVLARRSFVRFLYEQLNAMINEKPSIFRSDEEEIHLKENIKFHLYINTIPCGDARVFSLKGLFNVKNEASPGSLRMKKIGRTAPLSENCVRKNSMSCSDKIARWNVLGLQGSLLAKFIKPIYLESVVLGSSYVPIHLYRAIFGRLENGLSDLPKDYILNKPKFESTSLIETENFASSEDYGVCWSYGDGYAPEILDLHTGLTISGQKSNVSKLSFMNMYKSINQKLSNRSNEGIEKFNTAKKTFYAALKNENFGDWTKKPV